MPPLLSRLPRFTFTPERNLRILVVDDNEAIHEDFRKILEPDQSQAEFDAQEAALFGGPATDAALQVQFELSFASQGEQALAVVDAAWRRGDRFALVFMDMRMPPGWDGMETALRLWQVDPDLQVVVCTAYADRSWEEMMHMVGTPERVLVLKKPFDTVEVLQLAHALTEKWALLQASRRNFEDLDRAVQARTRDLELSEQRFRKLSHAAPIGIFETDALGAVTYTNPQWQRISGLAAKENLGAGWLTRVHPEDASALHGWWLRAARDGASHLEFRFLTSEGTERWVDLSANPIRSDSGELTGYVGSLEDITERKAIALELERARDAAVESARLKSSFLANMSHEIRTPMNGVLGMTDLLLDTPLNAEQREFTEAIRESGEGLLTVINDILDFSKVEAGKMQFQSEDFDLRELVESTLDLLAESAQKKRLELVGYLGMDVPLRLRGDRVRVRQILTNLISNGVKFTPAGEVVVRVSLELEYEGGYDILFEISDTGIGIEAELQDRLFEPFHQADVSAARKYGGTGLGLAICRQLVERMDGRIWAETVPGSGSKFSFTLCLEAPVSAGPAPIDPKKWAGRRVLIVEHQATTAECVNNQLIAWGASGEIVTNASAALTRLSAPEGWDLILVDLNLPEEDGLALAAKMRSMGWGGQLVLLVNYGARISPESLSGAGVAGCLTKPVRQLPLFGALGTTGAVTLTPDAALMAANTSRLERVLIVEDHPINQMVALGHVAKLGYTCDVASNGREALAAFAQRDYEIVLMDCQMPEMDGYAATAAIRARQEDQAIRTWIIALTADAVQGVRERCLAAGMDDYVTKPVRLDALTKALNRARPVSGVGTAEETEHLPLTAASDGVVVGTILVAEDHPTSAKLITTILKKENYKVHLAGNGEEALQVLRQNPGQINLLLTDIGMPGMDGLELVRILREEPDYRTLPVIFATSSLDPDTLNRATALGCSHYVLKPINAGSLLENIRTTLSKGSALLKRSAQVMRETGLDEKGYQQMVLVFAEQLQLVAEQLSLGGISSPALLQNAAILKETAMIFGAVRLQKALDRLSVGGSLENAHHETISCLECLQRDQEPSPE